MLHAFTDGDQSSKFGSRVLITDDKLWPMAKGCLKGPETRECYFEPLKSCQLTDVDKMRTRNSYILMKASDEYDQSLRTVYTSNSLVPPCKEKIFVAGHAGE